MLAVEVCTYAEAEKLLSELRVMDTIEGAARGHGGVHACTMHRCTAYSAQEEPARGMSSEPLRDPNT